MINEWISRGIDSGGEHMTSKELREALTKEPFAPFTIHLGGTGKVRVVHPEFVAVAPSGRTAVVYQPDDSYDIVDVLMIQSLEFGPHGRGRPRRRKAG
jgi:hypothetical protein